MATDELVKLQTRVEVEVELRKAAYERIRELEHTMSAIIYDYDRRITTWHGRFLLWLLRKTT